MKALRRLTLRYVSIIFSITTSAAFGQAFFIDWHTIDGGGGVSTSAGGEFTVSGTIGQPDAGVMSGGGFTIGGGFSGAGTGVPAATLTAAVSRKSCALNLLPQIRSEPRQGGITQLRVTFDVEPGGPGANPVSIEQATCAAQAYVPYAGASAGSGSIEGNTLVLNFTPGLENARTYRLTIGPEVTRIPGQTLEVRGLVGDANHDGLVNASDRSVVVGVWTGAGFSCASDLNSSGATNASDRSIVVGAWTGGQNCAP
jgi:hypothetical protein